MPTRPTKVDVTFKKTVLDREFRAEGVAVADVNRDGRPDILAGNLWYEAPFWTPHEILPPQKFDPATGYSNCFLSWASDVNRDGWPDQIVVGFPGEKAVWHENPRGESRPWKEHTIWRSACNESPHYADLLGSRMPVLVFPFDESQMAWFEVGADPMVEFTCHSISEPKSTGTARFYHGMGVGDINGDGRAEVLCREGYWEQPADPRSGPWKFVPCKFGADCAQMLVYDVNGDGIPDVITSSAHGVGIWWWEQRRGPSGPEFAKHVIDESFSQSHSIVLADINGDGVMDIVTGKRFWAHGPSGDINPNDPAVLCWFELKRHRGKVEWIKHQIDDDSGVGTQFTVTDVNRDGMLDIVVSNKKGVFYFEQQERESPRRWIDW